MSMIYIKYLEMLLEFEAYKVFKEAVCQQKSEIMHDREQDCNNMKCRENITRL